MEGVNDCCRISVQEAEWILCTLNLHESPAVARVKTANSRRPADRSARTDMSARRTRRLHSRRNDVKLRGTEA